MRPIKLLTAMIFIVGVCTQAVAQRVTVDLQQFELEDVLEELSRQMGYAFYHSRPTVQPIFRGTLRRSICWHSTRPEPARYSPKSAPRR